MNPVDPLAGSPYSAPIMKEDYVLKGTPTTLQIQLEKEVAETLKQMVEFTRFGESEIINVAVKRFIALHSDFLPRKK